MKIEDLTDKSAEEIEAIWLKVRGALGGGDGLHPFRCVRVVALQPTVRSAQEEATHLPE